MSSTNEYYSKEAIEKRVFGGSMYLTSTREKHNYFRPEDFASEIINASDTGDHEFFTRVTHALVNRISQEWYGKGVSDARDDVRKKLGL